MTKLTPKEMILGILMIPVCAAMLLSGMAVANEELNSTSVTVFAVSTVLMIILITLIRHEGRRL